VRCAVLGDPIAHSLSPVLHRAAYDELGLDWQYEAVRVASGGLAAFLSTVDDAWRGLSLTMPLKREVLPALRSASPMVDRVGAANTVLVRNGALEGFNTDVAGIIGAFREVGVDHLESVHVLGAGATAASVLVAVADLGATRVLVSARDPEKAAILGPLATANGIDLTIRSLGVMDRSGIIPSAVISTLPGGAPVDVVYPEAVRTEAALLDVTYDPWPSPLATQWAQAGGIVAGGLSMLLHQAVAQVRIFVTGSEGGALEDEKEMIAAMRTAVGL
jgi:shikimate dehydrogenase